MLLVDFRRWALSEHFPEQGRIDYVNGRIEVDMAAEDLFCHGSPKTALIAAVVTRVKKLKLGFVFATRTRVSSPTAQLSVEPDVVFVAYDAIQLDRVKLIPKPGKAKDRFVELQGAVDLIVEIVSDSSEVKDKGRLPKAYFAAGVQEYWLVDARGEEVLFSIYRRGKAGFQRVRADANGFQRSAILGCSYRMHRERDSAGLWIYQLQERI